MKVEECFAECEGALRAYVQEAERVGGVAVVKEHVEFLRAGEFEGGVGREAGGFAGWMEAGSGREGQEESSGKVRRRGFNHTVLFPAFLRTWQPVFLIRHPALAFPSRLRAMLDLDDLAGLDNEAREAVLDRCMTLVWSRALYDWFLEQADTTTGVEGEGVVDGDANVCARPIVIDADDVMNFPVETVGRLCELVGLDGQGLRTTWVRTTEGEGYGDQGPMERRMMSTLWSSEGVVEGKTAIGLDVEEEARKWREMFGEEDGERMEGWVRAAMEDYEYLRAARLRPGS